jgi:transposase InsO family protein
MPWKETDAMDLRTEFAKRAMREDLPFAVLCREYGISTKTGYKWKQRFIEQGVSGLADRSRRPHHSPNRVSALEVCDILRIKHDHEYWGPKKVHEVYAKNHPDSRHISLNTVKRLLDRAGLVEKRPRRRRAEHCGRISMPVTASQPNDVWTVDFKGHWYTADRQRVLPLTTCDACTRFVLMAQIVPDAGTQTVMQCFIRLFEQHGLPKVIRSDNGAPFASTSAPLGLSRLSAWWVSLGINLDRIEKGKPYQNGSHERMHREIALEVEGRVQGNIAHQQAALDAWRHSYNHERPHEGIGNMRPAQLYRDSDRKYVPEQQQVEYPLGYLTRKANKAGCIKLYNRLLSVSVAVSGMTLGLEHLRKGNFNVWFGILNLGSLDLNTEKFTSTGGRVYALNEDHHAISSN